MDPWRTKAMASFLIFSKRCAVQLQEAFLEQILRWEGFQQIVGDDPLDDHSDYFKKSSSLSDVHLGRLCSPAACLKRGV